MSGGPLKRVTESWKDANECMNAKAGKDEGSAVLGTKTNYRDCIIAEYVWLDANNNTRSKARTVTHSPRTPEDLSVWNFDGSSTEQADGSDSEVFLLPRAIFKDPFRGGNHVLVLAECFTPGMKPAIGNHRAKCTEIMNKYEKLDPWFGIEQEYTLMAAPSMRGVNSLVPLGFNVDGSQPAAQGPYYCGAGQGVSIGREVADEHYAKCLQAGIKITGINAEVMPGQWEFQVGPCRGLEMGDHLHMARYILKRVTETLGVQVSIAPKPIKGDWNGAGCHTNFSIAPMRADGGYETIVKVCEAFGKNVEAHVSEYGEGNDERLTGKHETCNINQFKYGVADRGASIRIPRDTFANKKGYMEDRRPAANCDPYRVTAIIMKTTGEALS